MPFHDTIDDVGGLRRLYADPHPIVLNKVVDRIDAPAEVIAADLEHGYAASMWQPGGGDAPAR